MSKIISREAILAASDIRTVDVEVPEWGGTVRLRELTAAERDEFEQSVLTRRGGQGVDIRGMRARLVAMCAQKEDGTAMFTADDAAALSKKSGFVMDRLAAAALKLSKLTDQDVKDLAVGFPGAQGVDSPSA